MLRLDIDSSPELIASSHCDLIVQRLSRLGIPEDKLSQGPRDLVAFVKTNKFHIWDLATAILPSDEDVNDKILNESMVWLQWLMFEGEPGAALENLAKMGANQRGVCGAVWGNNDIAYRCRTCEHDPTCAICVPCFKNGNHEDHDYSVIYTGGGCCDCGDITAWKREGFCSKHKGAEQIQPLPKHVAESLGPVLDLLLNYWKNKLHAKSVFERSSRASNQEAGVLTSIVVEMLLNFCKNSESLLSFISQRVYSSAGLLDVLLRAERFLQGSVVKKLHELLLKMLGEPTFKYEFSKVFVQYYPTTIDVVISEGSDIAFKKYPLLTTFSVQILTVPTLTPRLVLEMNLLGVLLQCLGNMFASCSGDDGRLQVAKWANLYETTLRVVEDIRFVMSHSAVPKYLCYQRRDLVRTWMKLLASVQGMNTQKRETGNYIEDENENVHLPFVLCHSISNILSLLVAGAFSVSSSDDTSDENFFRNCEDQDNHRHAKVGRLSQESSVSSITGKGVLDLEAHPTVGLIVPSSVSWLIYECLRSIENWLDLERTIGPVGALSLKASDGSSNNFLALRRTFSRFRRSRYIFKSSTATDSKPVNLSEVPNKQRLSSKHSSCIDLVQEGSRPMGQDAPGGGDDSLPEAESSVVGALRFLSLPHWSDITFDASSQEVSVHIPLHRLLSMVLRRALKECYGESGSSYVLTVGSAGHSLARSDDLFSHILEGCHPHGFSALLMEHPMRIRVFFAEVHAGMWRRNGEAPLLFSEWYRSVSWYEQGQELDLFLLQCCAAMAPPDFYVQKILERFGLSNYLSLDLEQSSEYEPTLVTEMLTLLIQIVKERRFCGMTTAECLRRELVQKLSIGDATRSQIVKSIPRDLSKVHELQEVLDRVAEYSHPSGMNQGMYKLRSSCWKELDLYHPRWNLRDQQAAEERYLRFCNVSALTTQLPCWTKIYHPLRGIAKVATCKMLLQIIRAILFYAAFPDKRTISRAPDGVLLTALHLLALALDVCRLYKESDDLLCGDAPPFLAFSTEEICTSKYGSQSVLSLLVSLLRIHEKENAENFMEAGNFNLSPLILSLIKNFVELDQECMNKLQKLAPQLANQFSHSVSTFNSGLLDLTSDTEARKAKARERQAAILEKMRTQQSKFLESINSSEDSEMVDTKPDHEGRDTEGSNGTQESAQVTCSLCHDPNSERPLSFLVLLQKSRLLSFADRVPLSWEQVTRSGKEHVMDDTAPSNNLSPTDISDDSEMIPSSQLEDMVQSAVNDFASVGQPQEVNAFIEFIKAQFASIKIVRPPGISIDTREKKVSSLETLEEHMYWLIRESLSNLSSYNCQRINDKKSTFGSSKERSFCPESLLFGKYISALPKEQLDSPSASQTGRSIIRKKTRSMPHLGLDDFGPRDGDGIYISSCGHAVHQGCLDRYLSSLRDRYSRRIIFEGGSIVDPDQGEFLCPVCRGLANSVLPTLPGELRKDPHRPAVSTNNIMDVNSSSTLLEIGSGSLRVQDGLTLLQRAADVAGHNESLKFWPVQNSKTMPSVESISRLLCGIYYPFRDKILETQRASHSLILWDTLKYSIMSTEIAARSQKSLLGPNYSLGALYKELNSSCGFILSLLLEVIQSVRTMDSLTVLLRFQGVQIFAKTLCLETCATGLYDYSTVPGGNFLFVLENVDPEVQYPDIQLWKRASEPILAHDSFSSFLWTVFCLPWPMLSCKESILSLLHVFYVVTVTQAIITCLKKRLSIGSELEFHNNLISDIYQLIVACPEALQYFESFNVDPTGDISASVRSLTFPYLRRCALFWKLINNLNVIPFGDGDHGRSWSGHLHPADDLENATNSMEELSEVEKLEKMFNIPSFDLIINNKESRVAALRWLIHFLDVFKAQRPQRVLRCSPAVPFKLMLLPHLYQDLLQRYIKKCCPECGGVKEEPALCLLCGKLCSPSWTTCCRESGCQTHATVCGAGIGIFILIRRTTILLQRAARQAHWPSPYLDAFGEEDVEMQRGKPLFLSEERYAALTYMVASHGLDRSSKVLRLTTIGSFFMF